MFFKILSAGLLLAALLGGARAVSTVKTDKPLVPPDLYFEFKEGPPANNGIINWRRAGEVMVRPTEKVRTAAKYCWAPGERQPDGETLADLQHWLNQNQEALRLFAESLQKPRMQWPMHDPNQIVPEYQALGNLILARLLEADHLAEAGHYREATRSLADSLRMTQCGVEGDASITEYLIAGLARERVQEAILRLAGRRQTPVTCLKQLLEDLPELDAETNAYAHILRVDFTIYNYATYDTRHVSENWSKIAVTNLAMFIFPEELRRPFKVLLDPSLVAQHPLPLDAVSNMKSDTRHFRIFRTNALGAWTNRSSLVEDEREETRGKLMEDIQPLMELVRDESLPLSRHAAQRAREAYLKIENPVGRILGLSALAENGTRIFRYRTGRAATRTVLALLIFERQKGRFPAGLADLVDAGILHRVPTDPFSGGPMLYSRKRQIVWSVGQNGTDEQGLGTAFHFVGDDAVWKISELN